jgi:hypothetical protein
MGSWREREMGSRRFRTYAANLHIGCSATHPSLGLGTNG